MLERKQLVLEPRSLQNLFVLAYIYMYLGVIRSRPTAYRKVTIQHNHLNRKNFIQNQTYMCKYNIKLIYLNFILCTCKFEKHKQSFLSENYEKTFPNKIIKNPTEVERE
jgi:hypothetical protein